jgi:hypothetical protein
MPLPLFTNCRKYILAVIQLIRSELTLLRILADSLEAPGDTYPPHVVSSWYQREKLS